MPDEWHEGLAVGPGRYDHWDDYPIALNVEPQDDSLDTTSQSTLFTQSSDPTSTVTNPTILAYKCPPLSRPSPLRSCLKKASSADDVSGKSWKRRVTIEHPDGQREPARSRSAISSVARYMRKFLSLALGFQSRSEWLQRARPRQCDEHSRRSMSRMSMAEIDALCLRDSFRRSGMSTRPSESHSILDFDDHPPRTYF